MNVKKMAAQDAARWARAEMFFGEGAGTRRKLLNAEITQKMGLPGYGEAFHNAYSRQNMADHAIKAAKERTRLDRGKMVKRNVRGLVTGNRQSLTTSVAVAAMAWYVAKETGLDEPIKREVKVQYGKAKVTYYNTKYKVKRAWRERKESQN